MKNESAKTDDPLELQVLQNNDIPEEHDIPKPVVPPKSIESINPKETVKLLEPTRTSVPQIVAPLPETEQKIKCTLTQLSTALAVSLLSLVIGYTTAFTSPSDHSLRRDFHIGNNEISWIGGLMPLSAVFGGLLGGLLIEYCGRKATLFVIDVIFLTSWVVMCCSTNLYHLYISRCLAGCSVGISTLTLPAYLVETVQAEVRDVLGLLPMTFGNIGILLCFTYGIFFEWKVIATIGIILTLPFLIFFLWIIPETPTWYVSRNKLDKARKTLSRLRGGKDVTKEFNDLIRTRNDEKSRKRRIKTLFKKSNIKPLTIALGLMCFQQFSGINAVIFYTTSIFRASGSHFSPLICTAIIGLVNLIATFIANSIIDRIGRKSLLLLSSGFMTVGLSCLGFYYYVKEIIRIDVSEYGFIPLTSLIFFVAGFSIGFGPIPWLIMGELLPSEIKSLAASMATALNWTCTFIVTLTFPAAAQMFGYFAIFWFYCCVVLTGGLLTWLFVPETRSVEEIERRLSGQRIQHMSSIVHLKPFPSTNL